MNKSNEMEAEIRALRERLSRLCAAVLRISSSLDLDTVLREVVASARALTDARYGVITTIDKTGQAQGLVTSGLTPDEHRQLAAWPDGRRLFEHLRAWTKNASGTPTLSHNPYTGKMANQTTLGL